MRNEKVPIVPVGTIDGDTPAAIRGLIQLVSANRLSRPCGSEPICTLSHAAAPVFAHVTLTSAVAPLHIVAGNASWHCALKALQCGMGVSLHPSP